LKGRAFLNSLPENPSALEFFQASIGALRLECPQAYQNLCRQLAGRELLIEIAGEAEVVMDFQPQHILLFPASQWPGQPPLRLRATWQTILDLVDARLTLFNAVYSGRLDLIGKSSELILLYDAVLIYLRGGVRTLSFPLLLDELRKTKGQIN
jgi:hypothetical protein